MLNWCSAHTVCQTKEIQRLATVDILDVLKKNKDLFSGIHTGIEGDGDPFSVTVEDFFISLKVSLLICEERSQAVLLSLQGQD